MKIYPTQIRIDRVLGEDQLYVQLESDGPARYKSIVFEISFEEAMYLLNVLRQLQAKYKIPIPPSHRPSGKPRLTVVTDDD